MSSNESLRELSLNELRAKSKLNEILNLGNYTKSIKPGTLLYVTDPTPGSNFFFCIEGFSKIPGRTPIDFFYKIRQRPANSDSPGEGTDSQSAKHLQMQFESWRSLVEEYTLIIGNLPEGPSDPILEQYEEEEYTDFQLLDEDAETHSFTLPVQRFIDAYLGDVVKRLEAHKETADLDETKTAEIEVMIAQAQEIKETQTQLTKQQVVKALSKFWAKARKAGLDIFTEVRKEALKEGVKYFTKQLLEDPTTFTDAVKGLLG
ncbi:hypothetical protein GCM10028805_57480 [Spirosoma harenae]